MTMLQVSQANALVYTTLVGFGFVGFYAGYRVKNRVDFLSGIKTQAGVYGQAVGCQTDADQCSVLTAFPLALNWIASS